MISNQEKRLSEKLKEHPCLIKCSIQSRGFSGEQQVIFPCYNSDNRLGIDYIYCHPDHLDEERQLCRADSLRTEQDKAIIYLNEETFKVNPDSLVKNS